MSQFLLADIGATNCRFALRGEDGRPDHIAKLRGDTVASLEAAIARYLDEIGVRVEAAVLAVAAPIEGDAVKMTNRTWSFRFGELAERFGWRAIRGINDFEAVAWGVPRLIAEDVRPLGTAVPSGTGARVVFGPGTGLGVAALVPNGSHWQVVPTEGGHVSFGPARQDEEPTFTRLRAQCGAVSAETILCGPGLERLYRAMHGDVRVPSSADIVSGAHANDNAASECVMLFVRLFGRFAGDLALMFKAFGGVYVGGGVSRRIGALLDDVCFREAFENHPPYSDLLRRIPTTLITFDEPGLLGCAAVAEEMMAAER